MKRKKILFIGEINKPIANANGICIEALAENLAVDNEVTISSYKFSKNASEEIITGVKYVRLKPTLFYRIREYAQQGQKNWFRVFLYRSSLMFNKFKKVMLLPFYPISSFTFIFRYYNFLKKIHLEENFDTIVSIYFPIDSLIVGYLLKKRFPDIKHIIYLVDTISNGAKVPILSKAWVLERAIKWEHLFMDNADITLIFNAHKEHYQSEVFRMYQDKIHFTDVPLFKPQPIVFEPVNNGKIKLLYSGSLIPGLRSPIEVLEILSQDLFLDFEIEMYTQGGFEEELRYYSDRTLNRIKTNGFVSHETIRSKISEANVLISIGNSHSEMIPSKTFEYMSTGKSIIHFYSNDGDTSLPYFKKYENCLLIDTRDNLAENTRKVYNFLSCDLDQIAVTSLESFFAMNTPEYTNKIILQ